MKPCPFCGSDDWLPSFHEVDGHRFVAVACDECEAEGPTIAIDGDENEAMDRARAAWNDRK